MLVVGFDFDGVIIYNPLHIARGVIAFLKKKLLKMNKTSFYKPKNKWQFFIWKMLFAISIPAKDGLMEIQKLKNDGKIYPILLTGRYDLSQKKIHKILTNIGVPMLFSEVITNDKNEQPHVFKERLIKEKKMKVYIEDNIDIVIYLNKHLNPQHPLNHLVKILWLYNIIDRHFNYEPKYPTLTKAVKSLETSPADGKLTHQKP